MHPPRTSFTPFDLKAVDEAGEFEGYASLFNREDLGRDVVLPGAFSKTLATRGLAGIRMLFQHDPAEPIGVWLDIREDAKGLFVRGKLANDVSKSRDVLGLMRAGAIDGLSIGYRAVRARRDQATGIRRLAEIDLWEISVVTFPMMPGARVSAVKARPFAARLPTPRELEHWLTRDAGLSRSEARAVMAHGLKGLAPKPGAGGEASPAHGASPAGRRTPGASTIEAALIAKIRAASHHLQTSP